MTFGCVILDVIVVTIILVLIIPLKIKIDLKTQSENKNNKEGLKLFGKIDIYILRVIKVKTIEINKKEKTNENIGNEIDVQKNVLGDTSKILNSFISYEKKNELFVSKKDLIKLKENINFQEFYLNLGFNLKEPILNAYILAMFNAILNMYIAKNSNNFNFEKTKYQTYISNKIIDFKFCSIINFKLVNTIIIILKLIINLRKVVNKNGKTTSN